MSSSVTSPITSPYSSTTSANGVLRRRNALSCSDSGRMSGTNQGGSAIADMSILDKIAAGRLDGAQQVLRVQDADDVLGRSAPERHARHRRGEHRLDHLPGRIVGVDRDHLGAVDHHVGDREVAQVEQSAEHVAVVLLDAALVMQQIDRAAQLLVRGENRLVSPTCMPNSPQDPAHQRLDRDQHRPEQPHRPIDRPRHRRARCGPAR